MRQFTIVFFLCFALQVSAQKKGQTFSLVSYNVENLFDCEHDSLKQDEEFLPGGLRDWNKSRMWKKINHIGQAILSCSEWPDGSVALPDLVALCEVENDSVLTFLTQRSLLRNAGYEYIMTSSPDVRGVDVALLYSPLTFRLIDWNSIRIDPVKGMRPTRDILYAKGRTASRDTLHILVVHAPSRYGGEIESEPFRLHVARKIVATADSIRSADLDARIVVAGDFNDYLSNRSLQILEGAGLHDVSQGAVGSNGALGTYKFRGEWGALDHIFLSAALQRCRYDCRVNDAPFLLTADEAYGGHQPHRTYQGVIYKGGFSDHLPLVLRIVLGE